MLPQKFIILQEARYSFPKEYAGLVRVLLAGGLFRLSNAGGSPSDAIDHVFDALGLSSKIGAEKVAKSEAKTCLAFLWQSFEFPADMGADDSINYAKRCSKNALLRAARRHSWLAPTVRQSWSTRSSWQSES